MPRATAKRTRKTSKSATKGRKATRTGTRRKDGIALLKADHREVEKMFKRFQGLSERALKTKGTLIQKICNELEIHDEIERAHLYPMTEGIDRGLTKHALDEHMEVNELIEQIRNTEPDDEGMNDLMETLISSVKDHVKEEEKELFPEMQKAFEKEDLMELGRELAASKRRLQARHRRAA